mmetsp:Transcript_4012/g.5372  ORF Transcript_4012/g.5372 Transcript_4012/m.5372 type:complete len:162 (+) Transcript_4012:87-572(+)
MPRDDSRSPERGRGRDSYRERDRDYDRKDDRYDRDYDRDRGGRHRDREGDDRRRRSRSRERGRREVVPFGERAARAKEKRDKKKKKKAKQDAERKMTIPADMDELEAMKAMGFPVGFDSTKGKKVKGNDKGAARIKVQRKYRQYMNRRGGFNRPLDQQNAH